MNTKKKVGVYAGKFSVFHVGHANILHQAQSVFDEVLIAISLDDNTDRQPFPVGHEVLKESKDKVISHTGSVADVLNSLDINEDVEVFLVRGLRNGDDLQREQNQLQFIKESYPSLKTAFFICDKKFEHISTQSLLDLKKISVKEYEKYVFFPPKVEVKKYGTGKGKNDGWGWGK